MRGAAAFGVGALIGCDGPAPGKSDGGAGGGHPDGGAGGAEKVAVIGAGAGGIGVAYFLHGVVDVDLFEARPKIGGHCDSEVVSYQGQSLTVDLGAQFFHPATHPIYVTLLEELGLYDPVNPDADQTLEAPGSICVFPTGGGAPVFASTQPLSTPLRAIDFAIYAQQARDVILKSASWEITVDEWIKSLTVSEGFKTDLLYPWISALIGTTRANALRSSARSILQTFALAFPANILEGASTFNSKIGLQGNLQRLLDRSPRTRVLVNAQVSGLTREGDNWFVQTAAGRQGPYRAVVLNTPPRIGRELVRGLPSAADVAALLDVYEYFDSRLVIHTDAAYVHRDRTNWAVYNAGIDGVECEGSAWLGGVHEKLAGGATVDVFKSWAQMRRTDPQNILLERRFKHPLITPAVIRASRALQPLQGQNGLYFSGQFTTGMDLQEAAIFSAMKVTEMLAPASPNLASLKSRLALRGHAAVTYAL